MLEPPIDRGLMDEEAEAPSAQQIAPLLDEHAQPRLDAHRPIVPACEEGLALRIGLRGPNDARPVPLRATAHRAREPRGARPRPAERAPDRAAHEPRGSASGGGRAPRHARHRARRGPDRRGAARGRSALLRGGGDQRASRRARGGGVSADLRHAAPPRPGHHGGRPGRGVPLARGSRGRCGGRPARRAFAGSPGRRGRRHLREWADAVRAGGAGRGPAPRGAHRARRLPCRARARSAPRSSSPRGRVRRCWPDRRG